jgi:aromatic-L-amino-acid/L-tryptophan decarboxylase
VEDAWIGQVLAIGDSVRLSVTGPCPRCVMTRLRLGYICKQFAEPSELVLRLYERLDAALITPAKTHKEISALFDESLPEDPQPMESIFSEVESKICANSTLYLSPRFFGYINSGGNQASILGELLAAAVNQILALWHFSPAASEVERRVIKWIAEFTGYPCQAGGCLLSGGSAGNLVGLAAARKQKAPFDADSVGMRGGPPLTVYASQEVHASVDKVMMILRPIAIGNWVFDQIHLRRTRPFG